MDRARRTGLRAFTLIELLVIVAIICAMAGVGVVSVRGGQGAMRVRGATRDVFAAIRHARSQALVSQKPVVVTYSTDEADGEVRAKVEVTSAKLFSAGVDRSKVRTLTGEPLAPERRELVHVEKASEPDGKAETDAKATSDDGGSLVEDVLFAPIREDVVTGMRLKVVVGDDAADAAAGGRAKRLSVFSNVDYLLGKFRESRPAVEKPSAAGTDAAAAAKGKGAKAADESQEPVSVVWETNGRVEPHRVWVYADGQRPEDGLSIRIDRFGAAKVISGDGREDDE